jgi:hypothetical protein
MTIPAKSNDIVIESNDDGKGSKSDKKDRSGTGLFDNVVDVIPYVDEVVNVVNDLLGNKNSNISVSKIDFSQITYLTIGVYVIRKIMMHHV